MKIGVTGINVGNLAVPAIGRLAELAEQLGYESFWTAEHIVLPDLPVGQAERPGNLAFLDSIAVMSYMAARTTKLKLATGVLLLPQHEPLLLAKQLASVDVLSGGRLIAGVGVGGIEVEAQALGTSMAERGARATEYLDAMIAVWTQEHPRYSGRFVSFEGINAYPRPVQQPHPPIHFGGRAPAALRRTVKYGSGWYGYAQTLDGTRELLSQIDQARQRTQPKVAAGEFEISIHPREPINAETVKAYAELGVHRLLYRLPVSGTLAEIEQALRDSAPTKTGLGE